MSENFRIEAPGIKAEEDLALHFRREVARLLGRKSLGFPGAQPVSFARKHLEELKRQDYYVCEKSDGIRYLLYCTSDNNREIHYLIDRKNDYWYVPGLHFPIPKDEQDYHVDTLIDGELVIDTMPNGQRQAKYLVFDCMVLDGNVLMQRTLDKRIAYFKERIYEPYQALYRSYPEEIQYLPFFMELKEMQVAYGIEMMFRSVLPHLPHGNDGLIFTCRGTEYQPGTDPHILKWKPEDENSVDLRLSLDFPVIQPDAQDLAEGIDKPYFDYDALPICNLLVHMGNSQDEWYGELYLEEEEWEKLKALQQPLDDRIVECYMDKQKRWRFMRFRDDKKEANHITTVNSVIESIRDAVTKWDLQEAAKGIRDAWKKRAKEAEDRARAERQRAPQVQGQGNPQGMPNGGMKRKAEDGQEEGRPHPPPP